ncbi:MAG: adenylosuccinate lyase [Candidatus Binatus sp.]|uniref:adenylosuccinate lyase n=1 Tax=Candidatus Binatus sp. TaxID=2811406 RepID=UPI0027269A51|nr:adenylosuccinate lyase [Candidatus Binatus sp.]MDO8434860.1 adenylosuccinate lyase [Candidatus Binatus sp.]
MKDRPIETDAAGTDTALMAVTPIDGRYRARTRHLENYFSEFALIRYRVRVEIEWYLSLAENPAIDAIAKLDSLTVQKLRRIYEQFTLGDARRVKELEATTNHDVKAVEYFLKERIAEIAREHGAALPVEMVHFACTSEDINNLAYALILKEFVENELTPAIEKAVAPITALAHRYKSTPMLARTHGQEASPTTVGKEMAIFAARIARQLKHLHGQEFLGKLNGAVGNFNAHRFAYPEVDWIAHSQKFVAGLRLVWNPLTTQIESHDFIAELFAIVARIDTILLGFCRDMWSYISIGYFAQKTLAGETGSSVMPHKVNPIDFENCEGNLGIANSLLEHLAGKLPISRWQRDLTDSTAIRAMGTAFAHVVVALVSLERGLARVEVDEHRIAEDLDAEQAWEVVAEAIQTLMRRYGMPRPYETLKELTRGRRIDRKVIAEFIASLPLDEKAKAALGELNPRNYIGLAAELVERFAPAAHEVGASARKASRK